MGQTSTCVFWMSILYDFYYKTLRIFTNYGDDIPEENFAVQSEGCIPTEGGVLPVSCLSRPEEDLPQPRRSPRERTPVDRFVPSDPKS